MINLHSFHTPCEMFHGFFAFSITKNIIVLPAFSKFTVKLIFVLLWDQHQAFVTYFNQKQLIYNFLWYKNNLTYNQLCNHFFDLLHFFEYYQLSLNHFLLVDQKKISINRNVIFFLFLQLEENIRCVLFDRHYFQTIKQKVCLPL